MATVEKLSILSLILYFVVFLVIEIILGFKEKDYKQKAANNPKDEELQKTYKYIYHGFRWFPAAYVVFILFMMLVF